MITVFHLEYLLEELLRLIVANLPKMLLNGVKRLGVWGVFVAFFCISFPLVFVIVGPERITSIQNQFLDCVVISIAL